MEGFKISTGVIRLEIDCDGEKSVIAFNPNDVNFTERFYKLFAEINEKQKEYEKKIKLLEDGELDENQMPVNVDKKIELLKEICEYFRNQIDFLFGEGTSEKVFGSSFTLEAISQFFAGITPFIEKARNKRLDKYKKPERKNVMK